MESKELAIIVAQSGIEKTKAQTVLDSFSVFFEQASEWELKTRDLVITDVSQVAEMKMARDGRLQLKEVRVNAEKAKKKLKENILIEGRFIDSIYNLIEGVTKPIEAELLEKEKFAERKEESRKAAIRDDRIEKLSPYEVDSSFYDLANMPDESFLQLLENTRLAYEAREESRRKEEDDRIAKEKAEADERARVAIENEKLKKAAELREKEIAVERAKAEAERKEKEEKENAERARQEKLLKQARDETERVKAELKAKAEAEEKARREESEKIESERQAKIKAERALAKAGDRGRILAYVASLEAIPMPIVDSAEAKALIESMVSSISSLKISGSKL